MFLVVKIIYVLVAVPDLLVATIQQNCTIQNKMADYQNKRAVHQTGRLHKIICRLLSMHTNTRRNSQFSSVDLMFAPCMTVTSRHMLCWTAQSEAGDGMTQEAAAVAKWRWQRVTTSTDMQQQICEDRSIVSLLVERRGRSVQLNVDGDVRDCRRPAGTYSTETDSWVLGCPGSWRPAHTAWNRPLARQTDSGGRLVSLTICCRTSTCKQSVLLRRWGHVGAAEGECHMHLHPVIILFVKNKT